MASDFSVTLLGTGYPAPLLSRFGPSALVEAGKQRLLFDCGRGTTQRIWQIEQNAATFNKLFLTHLHSDHTTGIPDLWITGYIIGRKETPLHIWGPKGTSRMMDYIEKAFTVDKKVRKEHGEIIENSQGILIEATDIDEGIVYEKDGLTVTAFHVNHFDLYSDEPSLGYRVDYNSRSIVISGDTRYSVKR